MRTLFAAACIVVGVTISVVVSGWGVGIAAFANGCARVGLLVAAAALAAWLGGDTAAWCSLPLLLAAAWFGNSPLGILNFIALQWFGVRLQAEFSREAWLRGPRGRWWAADAPTHGPVAWSLLRWVWPLTGWWSRYRWIARLP